MTDYTGNYIAGDQVTKLTDIVVGKFYILHNADRDTKYLVHITELATNSKDFAERATYHIIDPDTKQRGLKGINDFDFTLWDHDLEPYSFGGYSHILYSAISPVRKYRTFALIVSYGITWYGADSRVRRVFFAKRNPADHEDSRANFYYREQISASSVLRILRVIDRNRYRMEHNPIIHGARLWDKDMPDDEGATPYCRMPSVDISFDVPI